MPQRPPLGHHIIRLLPKQALTEIAGRAAGWRVAPPLRAPIYRAYARAVGADLSEVADPIETHETFNRFFARALQADARPIAEDAALVSPSDGRVDACGRVEDGQALQAKGLQYSVDELVGRSGAGSDFEGGVFATVYLSPADYHRVHAPIDMQISAVRHIAGELWPVNGLSVPWVNGLFRRNERVVFEGTGPSGPVALVMVAATVVGQVQVSHPDVALRRTAGTTQSSFSPPWRVGAGDELGAFLLGSTAVVLCADPKRTLSLVPEAGASVRMGAPLYR